MVFEAEGVLLFGFVLAMMFGELNASHLAFHSTTWPATAANPGWSFRTTRHCGLRFVHDADGGPVVESVIPGTPAHAARPAIEPGDRLRKVGGQDVPPHACLARLFNGPMRENLRLEFVRLACGTGSSHELRAIPYSEVRDLARRAETARMLRSVGTLSDGRAGYPSDRAVYAIWNKPIMVVCNQDCYSNAEVFARAVQATGRGQLVGTPTAGWVISALTSPLLDIGRFGVPFRGWFHPHTGRHMELGPAAPDHLVALDPGHALRGEDPQLEKAVQVLLEELARPRPPAPTPVYRREAE